VLQKAAAPRMMVASSRGSPAEAGSILREELLAESLDAGILKAPDGIGDASVGALEKFTALG